MTLALNVMALQALIVVLNLYNNKLHYNRMSFSKAPQINLGAFFLTEDDKAIGTGIFTSQTKASAVTYEVYM